MEGMYQRKDGGKRRNSSHENLAVVTAGTLMPAIAVAV